MKVQICDSALFPAPVARLDAAFASPIFVDALSKTCGIQNLLSNQELLGGVMHLMNLGGHLDVHVDFNYVEERSLQRRQCILVFLNEEWSCDWGGILELWDPDVKKCVASFEPALNSCVLFETSEISHHGETPMTDPSGTVRKSFAGYYYTREWPEDWTDEKCTTVFRARASACAASHLMPPERVRRVLRRSLGRLGQK
ncbi:MAG: 2OG-Fe(II) oxygenase [Planctomycetes bacterium]|nr:2OG-Fe(II) oxygenase [Planctomycetota bacterium]